MSIATLPRVGTKVVEAHALKKLDSWCPFFREGMNERRFEL
jgi:hypothetical protein